MSYNIYTRGADQSYKIYIPPVKHNSYLFYFNDYKVIQIPFHLQLPKVLIIFPNFTDTICYDDAMSPQKIHTEPKKELAHWHSQENVSNGNGVRQIPL